MTLLLFLDSITAVLVSRFLLHLQSAHRNGLDEYNGSHAQFESVGTLVFERIIGSLAESIDPFVREGEDLQHETYELEYPMKPRTLDPERTSSRAGGTSTQ